MPTVRLVSRYPRRSTVAQVASLESPPTLYGFDFAGHLSAAVDISSLIFNLAGLIS